VPAPSRAAAVAALLAAAAAAGCVERKLMIRSEPEGVPVVLNGVYAGVTPVEVEFLHYGVVRVEARPVDRDGDGEVDFRGAAADVPLDAPWYQWFPFDFITDNLWPGTLSVRREAHLVLPPAEKGLTEEERRDLDRRAAELKERAANERLLRESAPAGPPR
jgi:hypothetical protein